MDPNVFYSGLFPPQRMCAQVDEDQLVQFIGYWVMYNKPCVLKFIPSEKAPTLVGICFTVRNDDRATLEFMTTAVSKTGAKLWNLTEEKEKKK